MYVIISGTPTKGFSIIGPFSHAIFAQDWGDAWEEDIDWWVSELIPPTTREIPNSKEYHHD
jgi:hypothetical protein